MKNIWDTKNPKKNHKTLTSSQKSSAKERARKAGRPYPSLIDNMAAAKTKNEAVDYNKPENRMIGSDSLTAAFKSETPGQTNKKDDPVKKRIDLIKQISKNINTTLQNLKPKGNHEQKSRK